MRLIARTLFFTILFTNVLSSQVLDSLMQKASQEFNSKNYSEAKIIYHKIIAIDRLYTDAYYDLASVYLALNEQDKACEIYYKLYVMGAENISGFMIKHCGGIKYADVMWINDIDVLPKYEIRGKLKPFFLIDKNGKFQFRNFFKRNVAEKLMTSKILKKLEQVVLVLVWINKNGEFCMNFKNQELEQIQEDEILRIYNSIIKLKPGKFQGKKAGVGYFYLTLHFKT